MAVAASRPVTALHRRQAVNASQAAWNDDSARLTG
jgi:hypothetical protein